ncbi:C40 family peptidase [Isoptericola jiangsuensis]|uniref:C40 family peptidase n=1 Tax=Isoptericola jiangsuensis TaxID=548579 RepID=UPI003AAE30D3
MSLTAALAGGTLVAGAGTATAAPTTANVSSQAAVGSLAAAKKSSKPSVKVSLSRTTGTKGKKNTRPKYTVKATSNGKAVKGQVKIFIDGKKVNTKKLNKNGIARLKPTWGKYDTGRNKIRLTVVPAKSTGLQKVKTHRTVKVNPKATNGSKVVSVAHQYVGARYVYGGSSPRGFDCSGFTSYVYKKATGKTLPRSSSAQRSVGKKVSRSNAKPGDIVYTPGHVAIYAGNGKVIEAGNPRTGVIKRKMWQSNPTFIRV